MSRILVGDGDQTLCDIYRRFFVRHGYEVDVADGGVDCVARLRLSLPDLLILDLDLPWRGGDGVLAWIREESPALGIPVLLTASDGHPQDCADFIQPPVLGYLPKPFALTKLLESVRTAVVQGQQADQVAALPPAWRDISADHWEFCS